MTLVLIETADNKIKKSSLEAVAYAHALGNGATAVVCGEISPEEANVLGQYGADKILQTPSPSPVSDEQYVYFLEECFKKANADVLVMAQSILSANAGARLSVRLPADFVSNAVSLPDADFCVKRSIYTGKAFERVQLKGNKKIIAIKKNCIELKEVNKKAEVISVPFAFAESKVKTISRQSTAGEVLLSDAAIVVSGGRGMKSADQWHILENLGKALGAGLACTKPVSDEGWRPHHEHVGQTGIKVSPQLYIAVGISGAIQHVAGMNASKCIVVINKDPEAPFFKVADYGIVGDAFEVVPKLTEALMTNG